MKLFRMVNTEYSAAVFFCRMEMFLYAVVFNESILHVFNLTAIVIPGHPWLHCHRFAIIILLQYFFQVEK